MKKIILTLIASIALINLCFAQWNQNGSVLSTSNAVSIGTTTPDAPLTVAGSGMMQNISNLSDQDLQFTVTAQGATNKYALIAPSTQTNLALGVGGVEKMRISNNGYVGIGTANPNDLLDIYGSNPVLRLTDNAQGNTSFLQELSNTYGGGLRLYDGTAYSIRFQGGNIGINTTDNSNWQLATSTYKLAVNGAVIATSMTVKLNSSWPDYVFKSNYGLPALSSIRAYIAQYHHLPDMPSAEEVAKNGLNLGETDKLLTQKVEELTLYMIAKDEQNNKQQVQLDAQKKTNALLQARLSSQEQVNLALQKEIDELKKQLTTIIKSSK